MKISVFNEVKLLTKCPAGEIIDKPVGGRKAVYRVLSEGMDDGKSITIDIEAGVSFPKGCVLHTLEVGREKLLRPLDMDKQPAYVFYTSWHASPLVYRIVKQNIHKKNLLCTSVNKAGNPKDFYIPFADIQALFVVQGVSVDLAEKDYPGCSEEPRPDNYHEYTH